MSSKFALIIGNTEYTDPGLAQLSAPGKDAEDLARVLKDKEIAAFDDVKVIVNESSASVIEAVDEFFDRRKPEDLLVLYFSGHGIRDEIGSLYLAFKNTIRSRLRSTAIKSDYIKEAMDQSRSKRQVLILDCCNSGAFPQGTKAELGGSMGMTRAFQGYGRFVLTASDATQFAWEGDRIIGKTDNSLFTHFLVKGLEGEADSDGDGRITVDELYDYAFYEISKVTPKQTPTKSSSKQEGEIVLRQFTRIEDIKPVALPEDLIGEIGDLRPSVREWAVQRLEQIINGKNIGMARSAKAALEKMAAEDDSRRVAQMAKQALDSMGQKSPIEFAELQAEAVVEKLVEKTAPLPHQTAENTHQNLTSPLVFISYSRRDQESVNYMVDKMEKAGLNVWIDREAIKPGKLWRTQIVQAIDTCKAFVLMLSDNSAVSDNVRKEIDLAQDAGCTIFVVMLNPVKLPAEIRYQLAGLQHIDLSALGIKNGSIQLIKAVQEYLASLSPAHEQLTRQVELVLPGVDLAGFGAQKQEQLLDFISEMAHISQTELRIVNLTAGSVHVFVNMPALVAFQLKTLALNQDARYKQFGISATRLLGNRKYVDTALGILKTLDTTSDLKVSRSPHTLFQLSMVALLAMVILIVIVVAGILTSGIFNNKGGSQFSATQITKTWTPEVKPIPGENIPSKTPTKTPEPFIVLPDVFRLENCATSREDICLYSFAPQNSNLVIALLVDEDSYEAASLELMVKGQKYKCETLANYPGRLYCSGPSVTGSTELVVLSPKEEIIASGFFDIPKYVPPTVTPRKPGSGPYP